jgi:hypothetical protein
MDMGGRSPLPRGWVLSSRAIATAAVAGGVAWRPVGSTHGVDSGARCGVHVVDCEPQWFVIDGVVGGVVVDWPFGVLALPALCVESLAFSFEFGGLAYPRSSCTWH